MSSSKRSHVLNCHQRSFIGSNLRLDGFGSKLTWFYWVLPSFFFFGRSGSSYRVPWLRVELNILWKWDNIEIISVQDRREESPDSFDIFNDNKKPKRSVWFPIGSACLSSFFFFCCWCWLFDFDRRCVFLLFCFPGVGNKRHRNDAKRNDFFSFFFLSLPFLMVFFFLFFSFLFFFFK